jgi:CubicO group peptidase (beta-lactamase class C family)
MRPSALLLIVVLFSELAVPASAHPVTDNEVIAGAEGRSLDRWVSRMVPLGYSGGVLVSRDGKVLLARAYGDADRTLGTAARIDTLWPIGSISKHFTAAAVLRLQQDGQLSVFDRLDELLDDVPAQMAPITLHHLLSHTAGFPESSGVAARQDNAADKLAHAFRTQLVYAPGTDHVYSNIGYGVLAAVVESVSGQPYEDYLREHILLPAGMADTAVRSVDWPDERVARGMIDGQDHGRLDTGWASTPWWILGAGGVQMTLWDMYRWSQGLRDETVLDEQALATMITPHVQGGMGMSMGYGCGVFTTPRGTTMIGHNGSDDIFAADWRHYMEDGVTVFVTSNHADVYADVVSEAVTAMAFGMSVPLPPAVRALPGDDLLHYAGSWELADGGRIHLAPRSSGLLVSSDNIAGAMLVHPVQSWQNERREQLLSLVHEAFEQAIRRDFSSLHGLIDPFAPAEEFEEQHQGLLDYWSDDLGKLEDISTLPGRNRFGEIAVVVRLAHERGDAMIEYSFGQEGVGAIRTLEELPARMVHPLSAKKFVAYDAETGESWSLGFRLDGRGRPVALLLDGGVHTATRATDEG